MNLKLKRLVRTSCSEQYTLFDLDQPDEEGEPSTVGKLDLHYTAEGVYGTLLLWDEETLEQGTDHREDFVYALLDEVSQPMGVPNEYVVEFFAPELDQYAIFHNVGLTEDETQENEAEENLAEETVAGGDS